MENPIKIDDLGVPLFLETPICANNCGERKMGSEVAGRWDGTQHPSIPEINKSFFMLINQRKRMKLETFIHMFIYTFNVQYIMSIHYLKG